MLFTDNNGIPLQDLCGISMSNGSLRDYESVNVLGLLPTLAIIGAPATIWNQGGEYTFSASAVTHYISSSTDSDDQEMQINGLDENWLPQTITVTLNGRTKTAIEGTWIRINGLKSIASTVFAGTVYVYEDDTVTLGVPDNQSKIRTVGIAALQRAHTAIYTVPAGKTGFVIGAFSNIGPAAGTTLNDKGAELNLFRRKQGEVFHSIAIRIASLYENTVQHDYPLPYKMFEKTDLKIKCNECFVDDTRIYAGLFLILRNN